MAQRRRNEEMLRSGTSILKTIFGWGRSMPKLPKADYQSERRLNKAATEIEKYQLARDRLQAELEEAIAAVAAKWQAKAEDIKDIRLTPRKSDIRMLAFGIAWTPFWELSSGGQPGRVVAAYVAK
jgi:hypothetical protein